MENKRLSYTITDEGNQRSIIGVMPIIDLYRFIGESIDYGRDQGFVKVNIIMGKFEQVNPEGVPPFSYSAYFTPDSPAPPPPPEFGPVYDDATGYRSLNDYTDQPLPCPFCDGINLKRNYKERYFVQCLDCGATGPQTAGNIEDSQKAWNNRDKGEL